MNKPTLSRRGFAVGSLQAAALVAAQTLLRSRGLAASADPVPVGPASGRMHVTLDSGGLSDRKLRYMKQIGINDVELNLMHIPGYFKKWRLDVDDIVDIKKRLEVHGLRLESLYLDQSTLQNFLLGRPGGEKELDNVCHTIESMGRTSVPIFLFSLLASRAILTATHGTLPGYYPKPNGRGGSVLRGWDDDRATKDAPMGEISVEDTWDRLTQFQKRCVPVAEASNVILGCHPADPPVPRYWGVHQAEYTFDALKRYVEIVPSPNNRLLFCQGTIQEAGIDLFEYIRYFGSRGKIAHAELRGVLGTVPRYTETFMDEGDVSLWRVVKALQAVGFGGAIEVAHVPTLDNDANDAVIDAWSVGYVKGMLSAAYEPA